MEYFLRCLAQHFTKLTVLDEAAVDPLKKRYETLRGNRLEKFKLQLSQCHVNETDFINIKTPQLWIFDWFSFVDFSFLIFNIQFSV
jgi:hypothetical protein